MSTKRLFIGISATDGFIPEFYDMLKKTKIDAEKKNIEVKWTPVENFHITINFIGDFEVEKMASIEALLQTLSENTSPFDLKIKGVGAFPDLIHSRVVWAGVQQKIVLNNLKETLDKSLESLGVAKDKREFRPHLTLGRIRKTKSAKDLLSPFLRKKFGTIEVNELILYESSLESYFPVYKPLKRFRFMKDREEVVDELI